MLTVPLRVMAEAEARMAAALLGPVAERPARATGAAQRAARPPRDPGVALGVHAGLAAVAVAITCTVWLLTSRGSFWPVWVALGVTLTCGLHDAIVRTQRAGPRRADRLVATAEGCLVVIGVCVAVWALTGAGYPWPLWLVLGSTSC